MNQSHVPSCGKNVDILELWLKSSSILISVAEPELEPKAKLFCETEPEPESLLTISAPDPRLWSRNDLFNKYFTITSPVWRMPG